MKKLLLIIAPHSWGFLFVGGWVDMDKDKITDCG